MGRGDVCDRHSESCGDRMLVVVSDRSVPTPVSRRWVLAPPISLAAMPRMPLSRGRNEMQTGHSEPGSRCGRSQLLACSCRPARLIPQSLSRRWPVGVPARDRDILAVFDSSIMHARTMITPPTTSGSCDGRAGSLVSGRYSDGSARGSQPPLNGEPGDPTQGPYPQALECRPATVRSVSAGGTHSSSMRPCAAILGAESRHGGNAPYRRRPGRTVLREGGTRHTWGR